MKKIKIAFILLLFFVLLIYVTNITSIPNSIVLFQGEKINVNLISGLELKETTYGNYDVIQTSTNLNKEIRSNDIGKIDLKLSILGKIPVKNVSLNIIPKTKVIPGGNSIGLKLYTKGILIVGMSEIDSNEEKIKPYEKSGLKEGDMIISINKQKIENTGELIEVVNNSNGKHINIEYIRNGEILETSLEPSKTNENEYKMGLWVRDAAAGVGTISFYDNESGMFAALGHGIVDADIGKLLDIAEGEIVTSNIVSIKKGEKGKPGEIRGSIVGGTSLGKVNKNTEFGIYGKLTNITHLNINKKDEIEVGLRDEIKIGKAKIICSIDNNIKKEYDVEIEKIYKNNNLNNKSMLIKVTDEELLQLTGGIIQGMSGAPIIQNNKYIGSVTHVLVADPTRGYGVFADLMIKEMKKVD